MNTRTLLINHLTGCKITEWENEPNDITRLDEDTNGFWLIRVPDEEQYFMINPGDTIIFTEVVSKVYDIDGGLHTHYGSLRWTPLTRIFPRNRKCLTTLCLAHCASVTFKDYCDKENRLIKVKSYFRS